MIDESIALELWNRRHRKISNLWGRAEIPAEWMELRQLERGLQESYAIIAGDDLVGRLTLRNIDYVRRAATLGIYLAPSKYGHGLGTRAICMVQESWSELRLDVHYRNLRALTCYLRCGFRVSEITEHWVKMIWRKH